MTNEDLSIPLRQYLEARIDSVRSEVELQFQLHERALKLATFTLEERLAHLNELREAVVTQEIKYLTKGEAQLRFDNLERDVRMLLLTGAKVEGKASQNSVVIAWVMSGAGLVLGIVGVALRLIGK